MKTIFLAMSLLFSNVLIAQLALKITDAEDKAVADASVIIKNDEEGKLIRTGLSNAEGVVLLNIPPSKYYVEVSATGKELLKTTLELTEKQAVLKMNNKASDLQEVSVTAKKPFIQKLSDRLVVNVNNSVVNAGSTAYEVLERSPGVTIDPNDIIALRGRQGVIIMIDGKPSPMSGPDLVNYLRSLPSETIDRIELITNPSSRYDAAGNSGIIDIRMKKDQRMGSNGTISFGYGQGVYPKANAGTTFNFRNKKFNFFGNYNYLYRKNLNHLVLDRNFYDNGEFSGADLKDNFSRAPLNNHGVRLGLDFFASKRTVIGMVMSGNLTAFKRFNDNSSLVIDADHNPSFTFNTNAQNDDENANGLVNLNLKHDFQKKGMELTADLDYGKFKNISLSSTATSYYTLSGEKMFPDYILSGDQEGKLNFTTVKADLTNPLKNGFSMETGFKLSFVSSDNDAKFYDESTGVPINDATKTNHFLYEENNNAAYFTLRKSTKKFDLQAGLRAEQTNINTYQRMGDVKWDSSYIQLFPTAFVNYKFTEENVLGLSVSRRIDRPGYSQLNPFLFLIDVSTYATGNPGLLPQFTWSYELSYTAKKFNLSLNYSKTTKVQNVVIARFADVFPAIPNEDNVTVQIPVNMNSSDYIGLTASSPLKISKRWNMINNAEVFYNHFNGELGSTKLNEGKPAVNIRTTNNFTFNKGLSAELGGSFSSGGQYGFMVVDPQWAINAGVQKNILRNKGTIRLNVTDIFWTNLPKAVITYDNYIEKWHARRESRVVNIGFTYRFGKSTVPGARKRTTGSEEERRRAGG